MSHNDKENSDEEKILKYAEVLYGTHSLNAKQKLDIVDKLGKVYNKQFILDTLKRGKVK